VSRGSRVVVVGWLQQRTWTAEDGSARSTVEVVADELGEPAVGDGGDDQGDEKPGWLASIFHESCGP
jgi:single-stranded DNA-binding protein